MALVGDFLVVSVTSYLLLGSKRLNPVIDLKSVSVDSISGMLLVLLNPIQTPRFLFPRYGFISVNGF